MPLLLWILLAVLLLLFALGGLEGLIGLIAGALSLLVFGGLLLGAKRLSSRVVITDQYVESRDALRRTRRCERRAVESMVIIRGASWFGATVQQVQLVDKQGHPQLTFAWDSYSDAQLEEIRRALRLRHEPPAPPATRR